jgi:hypothetical protein
MCTEIVKYYFIVPLKGGHSSYRGVTFDYCGLIRGVASLEGNNEVVLYYLSAY